MRRAAGEKLDAGATLVQLYTGLIYRGPFFAAEVARALAERQRLVDVWGASAEDTYQRPAEDAGPQIAQIGASPGFP